MKILKGTRMLKTGAVFLLLWQSKALIASTNSTSNNDLELVFGIAPQQAASDLTATWQPIIKELSALSGKRIVLATASSVSEFELGLQRRAYDIAYMNPYHYAVFSEMAGYRAIAKQDNAQARGIIVVHKDSIYYSLSDLQDLLLVFPAPFSFAATLVPSLTLQQLNVSVRRMFVKSHDAVYVGVANGHYKAGGGVMRSFNESADEVRKQLRILWTSEDDTTHAIALSPMVDRATQYALSRSFTRFTNTPLLDELGFSAFKQAKDSEWDRFRAMNIDLTTDP